MLKKLIAGICFVAMLTMTAQAMPNWLGELQERVENSPMEAVEVLVRSLVNGVVEMEINDVDWHGSDERVMLRLYSNLHDADYAFFMEMLDRWTDIEVGVLSNTERLAMRISEFGDDFLGVTYASFADDLHTFLNSLYSLGLIRELPAESDLEMVINYVEMFVDIMNSDDVADFNPLEFADILVLLMLRVQRETTQVTITSGGEEVDVQRTELSVDASTMLEVLHNLLSRIDLNDMGLESFLPYFEELLDELAVEIDSAQGYAAVITYTDDNGRMRRVGINIIDYDFYETLFSIDFGASAIDVWVIEVVANDSWSSETFVQVWEVMHTDELRVHRLTTTETTATRTRPEPRIETIIGTTSWNPETGALTLHIAEEGHWGTFEETIEGTFTLTDSAFTLLLADEYTQLELSATAGTPVPRPAFINLDRWADVTMIRDLFVPTQTITVELVQPEGAAPITIEITELTLPPQPREVINVERVIELPTLVEYIVIAHPTAVVYNCHYLHLRRGPGASHVAFNHLPAGYVVFVLEVRGNWVQVATSRGTGWVFGRYLDFNQ